MKKIKKISIKNSIDENILRSISSKDFNEIEIELCFKKHFYLKEASIKLNNGDTQIILFEPVKYLKELDEIKNVFENIYLIISTVNIKNSIELQIKFLSIIEKIIMYKKQVDKNKKVEFNLYYKFDRNGELLKINGNIDNNSILIVTDNSDNFDINSINIYNFIDEYE